MSFHRITVTVNGSAELVDVPSNMTMLTMLREKLALTGTKNGCAAGECGACTVLWNGEPVNSCMVLAVECDGTEITTVEGLAASRVLQRPRPDRVETRRHHDGGGVPDSAAGRTRQVHQTGA